MDNWRARIIINSDQHNNGAGLTVRGDDVEKGK